MQLMELILKMDLDLDTFRKVWVILEKNPESFLFIWEWDKEEKVLEGLPPTGSWQTQRRRKQQVRSRGKTGSVNGEVGTPQCSTQKKGVSECFYMFPSAITALSMASSINSTPRATRICSASAFFFFIFSFPLTRNGNSAICFHIS